MKIKNTSGSTQSYALGRNWAQTLLNNAEANVPDDFEAISDALDLQRAGKLQITEAPAAAAVGQPASNPQHARLNLLVVTDTTTLTIGPVVFEFDNNSTYTAGRVPVVLNVDQSITAANLKTAINQNAALVALGIVATDIIVVSSTNVFVTLIVPASIVLGDLTLTASNGTVVPTKVTSAAAPAQRFVRRKVAVTTTTAHVVTDLATIETLSYQVRAADGTNVAYDGAVKVTGGSIYFGAGSTGALANGQSIHLEVSGQ